MGEVPRFGRVRFVGLVFLGHLESKPAISIGIGPKFGEIPVCVCVCERMWVCVQHAAHNAQRTAHLKSQHTHTPFVAFGTCCAMQSLSSLLAGVLRTCVRACSRSALLASTRTPETTTRTGRAHAIVLLCCVHCSRCSTFDMCPLRRDGREGGGTRTCPEILTLGSFLLHILARFRRINGSTGGAAPGQGAS